MKKIRKMVYIVFAILFGMFSVNNVQGISKKGNTLLGGASKVNITPEKPMKMSGYANRTGTFSGIHDSLFTSALVFSDGKAMAAIITTDLIALSHSFCNETAELIARETGISRENIMLSAAHNHGGPVTLAYRSEATAEEEEYVEGMKQKITRAVKDALLNLVPVKIGFGTGTCKMNINRRARFADGSIWLGRNPEGPCDHTVAVVRVDDLNNNPLAIFVNWPCHGTVGGGTNTEITGDWPGVTARFIEKALGNKVIVPVTAGASGDINPIYGPNDKFEDIDAIGMLLGEEVIDITAKIKTSSKGSVSGMTKTIVALGKKRSESKFPDQQPEPGDDVDITLSVVKVGNVVFAGVSGELFTEIGMDIKDRSAVKNTIVVTHCNGASGYLCTDDAYPIGGYEVMVSRTMPGTESLIRDGILEMIKTVQ